MRLSVVCTERRAPKKTLKTLFILKQIGREEKVWMKEQVGKESFNVFFLEILLKKSLKK